MPRPNAWSPFSLHDRAALVIGSANGIGAASAAMLASRGARVVLADVDVQSARSRAEEISDLGGEAVAVECDVRDESQVVAAVQGCVDRWGSLDILHNNAAAMQLLPSDGPVGTTTSDLWDETLRVNLRGQMFACKAAVSHMSRRGAGSIVNTSSVSGSFGDLLLSAYGVAKAGTDQLTRSVATQYGRHGVRCNAVLPGLIQVAREPSEGLGVQRRELLMSHQLLPLAGVAEDVAAAVAFLAGPESRFVTGHLLVVDGGLSAHMPAYADFSRFEV